MVLLTKLMRIITPLILSIVVCVALRLISYVKRLPSHIVLGKGLSDCIIQGKATQIVSYMGFGVRRKEKVNVAVQRFCVVNEVQLKRDSDADMW